jgi:hypothetical protein
VSWWGVRARGITDEGDTLVKVVTRLAGFGVLTLTLGLLVAGPSAQASTATTVTVPADVGVPGTATLQVDLGDSITVSATGTITGAGSAHYGHQGAAPCGPGSPSTLPDGSEFLNPPTSCGTVPAGTNAPMPNQPVGILIGRIGWDGGTSTWFVIGLGDTFTASHDGNLHLLYNDSVYSDNTGHYTATVTDNTN